MSQNRGRGKKRKQWREVETKMKGDAAVRVCELPLRVPRYSFYVGTASVDAGSNKLHIAPRLSTYDVLDAADLLKELGEKYIDRREAKADEIEMAKVRWREDRDD